MVHAPESELTRAPRYRNPMNMPCEEWSWILRPYRTAVKDFTVVPLLPWVPRKRQV